MTRTWLSISVDLVQGHGEFLWPRPGRIFAAARTHSFAALGRAIDDAFARWDRAHLHQFELLDGTLLTTPYPDWQEFGSVADDQRTRLSRLRPGEQFLYTFDLGDDWTHLCTVGPERIDPEEVLGIVPDVPLPFWGWGDIPDQYRRRWDGDDGESRRPARPARHRSPADAPRMGAGRPVGQRGAAWAAGASGRLPLVAAMAGCLRRVRLPEERVAGVTPGDPGAVHEDGRLDGPVVGASARADGHAGPSSATWPGEMRRPLASGSSRRACSWATAAS